MGKVPDKYKTSKVPDKYRETNTPGIAMGATRSFLQGMTFGAPDEIGSALAAIPASLQTGEPYGDVYSSMMEDLRQQREAFREEHPVAAYGSEIAGGVSTGVVGATKLAATKMGQQLAAHLPRWLQAAGIGGAEGATYGALSADPGERVEGGVVGGTTGVIAGPTLGWAVDKGGRIGAGMVRWAKNKLASTPRKEAIKALRTALEAEGLDADEAVKIYESLGPEGMLADIGDNFRALTRAATDIPGGTKAVAKGAMHQRQIGQGQRLLDAAEDAVGKRARDLVSTVSGIIDDRYAKAQPIYEAAYKQGIELTDNLAGVLERDIMKPALRQAKKIASGFGDEFSEGSLKHLHYAKMALYDQMSAVQRQGKRQLAGAYKKTYGDLLDAIGEQNKTYLRANDVWSDSSALLDAAEVGRKFFKMSNSEMRDAVTGMSRGEREMFQNGAMSAFQDVLDNTQLTSDATRKLINTTGTLKKLSMLFDDEAAAREFLNKAKAEAAFTQTRNVVAGGSPTSQNLAGQKFLEDAIQPDTMLSAISGDPVGALLKTASELFKSKPLTKETLSELSDLLLNKGMTAEQIRQALASPRVQVALTRMGEQWPTAARAAAGIAAPIGANNGT